MYKNLGSEKLRRVPSFWQTRCVWTVVRSEPDNLLSFANSNKNPMSFTPRSISYWSWLRIVWLHHSFYLIDIQILGMSEDSQPEHIFLSTLYEWQSLKILYWQLNNFFKLCEYSPFVRNDFLCSSIISIWQSLDHNHLKAGFKWKKRRPVLTANTHNH